MGKQQAEQLRAKGKKFHCLGLRPSSSTYWDDLRGLDLPTKEVLTHNTRLRTPYALHKCCLQIYVMKTASLFYTEIIRVHIYKELCMPCLGSFWLVFVWVLLNGPGCLELTDRLASASPVL